jgi:hypothetical protein
LCKKLNEAVIIFSTIAVDNFVQRFCVMAESPCASGVFAVLTIFASEYLNPVFTEGYRILIHAYFLFAR